MNDRLENKILPTVESVDESILWVRSKHWFCSGLLIRLNVGSIPTAPTNFAPVAQLDRAGLS